MGPTMGNKVRLVPPWYIRLAYTGRAVRHGQEIAVFRQNWRYIPFRTIRFVRSILGLTREYLDSLWKCVWNTIKVVLPEKWRGDPRSRGVIIPATEIPKEVINATKEKGRRLQVHQVGR